MLLGLLHPMLHWKTPIIIQVPQTAASLGSTFSQILLRTRPRLPTRPSVQTTWRIPYLQAFVHQPSIPGRTISSAIHVCSISSINSGRFLCLLIGDRSGQAAGLLKLSTQARCPMHQQEIRCRLVRHRPQRAAASMYTARLLVQRTLLTEMGLNLYMLPSEDPRL